MENRCAERFLQYLKMNGPQSTARIGKALGMTSEAARQQLIRMEKRGLTKATSENNGVGRPAKIWKLTRQGHAQFPDAHSKLTVQLIVQIRKELGEEALDKLISAHQREQGGQYELTIDRNAGLEERIRCLAIMRSNEGYMAEWRKDEQGYLFFENHCPICFAASVCQGFCRAELQTFRHVLGEDISVERVEHIQAGALRCAYRIREKN